MPTEFIPKLPHDNSDLGNCSSKQNLKNSVVTYLVLNHTNQQGACQPGEMYNVQKVKAEKGKHWPQKLHQTTGGRSQIEYPHPAHLL